LATFLVTDWLQFLLFVDLNIDWPSLFQLWLVVSNLLQFSSKLRTLAQFYSLTFWLISLVKQLGVVDLFIITLEKLRVAITGLVKQRFVLGIK
jgi:hypothetical protein